MSASRKDIAAAFRAAKAMLWNGDRLVDGLIYICHALEDCEHPAWTEAKRVIERRIGKSYALENWVRDNIKPRRSWSDTTMQTYRHRWLDALIAEFEQ